jgi:hypothetical protein
MRKQPVHPAYRVLRAIGRGVALVFVLGYALLDQLLFPLFRPLLNYFSGLRLFQGIGALLQRLPPYLVLLILAVPFVALEPLKIFALYWLALGHIIQGGILLIVAHALSILTLERLYHAGEGQLMKIGWFARVMGWITGLKDWALNWVKSTPAWKSAARFATNLKSRAARIFRTRRSAP